MCPLVALHCRAGMVCCGMVYVNLYSTIVANVNNALRMLVPGKQPSFQALFEGAKVLLCADLICIDLQDNGLDLPGSDLAETK